jgi:hypothetical protein
LIGTVTLFSRLGSDIEEDVDDLLPPTWGGFNGSDDSSLDLTLPRGRQRQHEQRDQHQPKAKLARFTYRSPSPVPSIPTQSSPVFPLPPIQSFPSVSQTAKQSTGTGRQRPPLFLSGSASDIEDLLPTPSTAQSRRVRKEKEKRKNGAWIDAGLLDDDGEEVDEPMESLPSRPAKCTSCFPFPRLSLANLHQCGPRPDTHLENCSSLILSRFFFLQLALLFPDLLCLLLRSIALPSPNRSLRGQIQLRYSTR